MKDDTKIPNPNAIEDRLPCIPIENKRNRNLFLFFIFVVPTVIFFAASTIILPLIRSKKITVGQNVTMSHKLRVWKNMLKSRNPTINFVR
jgi:hypothetical protein